MANQSKVKEIADKHSPENVVIIIGAAEAESAGLTAETCIAGDPTFAGPLSNVALKLKVYHIFELKDLVSEDVYEEQIEMMEMVLEVDDIKKEMNEIRAQAGQPA